MALADYFAKTAMSAASVLAGFDVEAFAATLERRVVGVAFDGAAADSPEGRHTLELLVDLLARLYPRLAIRPFPEFRKRVEDAVAAEAPPFPAAPVAVRELTHRLRALAHRANARVEFIDEPSRVDVWVVAGSTPLDSWDPSRSLASEPLAPNTPMIGPVWRGTPRWGAVPQVAPPPRAFVVYVGSSGWYAGTSLGEPLGSGDTPNPFGAAAAACLGAAATFRAVFAEQLEPAVSGGELPIADPRPDAQPDAGAPPHAAPLVVLWQHGHTGWLSTLTGRVYQQIPPGARSDGAIPTAINFGDTFLVGVGAIGQAAAWMLARTPGLTGTLHLVDPERLDATNPQRYLWTAAGDIGAVKTTLAARHFAQRVAVGPVADVDAPARLAVQEHVAPWAAVAAGSEYVFDRLLLALDTADDRVLAQASLPRWIANAWTQPENLGVSRHPHFGRGACVACLYTPRGPRKHQDQLVAEALGFAGDAELREVRERLATGRAVDEAFLQRVAERLAVPLLPLLAFVGQPLAAFYAGAVCGGALLALGNRRGDARRAAVPLAFQSALAGVLLAAELVADAAGLRERPTDCRTEIDLLRPLGSRLTSPAAPLPSGRCLCQDPIFLRRYAVKYRRPLSTRA